MITKRNTYRPHYFGFGGGDFQEVTEEGNSTMYQQQLAQQGLGQESGTNWGNVGMGAAGAASGLMGQIGVSEKNPNGLWDAADPMHYLANGRTSKFGEGASKLGIGLTQAGLQSGNPWLAVAGAAVKIVGDLGNAGWGHKTNEEQLARINQGIDAANNFQSNAYSFDTLQDPMTLASAGNVYEGGWFNKKKWNRKNDELQANTAKAQANVYNQFNNNLSNLQQDQMNNMLANYAAFGGPIKKRKSFDDWYKTVPTDRNDTTSYNLRRAYELAPMSELEAWRTSSARDLEAGRNHLRSVYMDPKTGIYEFMKSKNHPTINMELDWYNGNTPEAVDFRNQYDLDTSGDYYRYVPKKAFGGPLHTHGSDWTNGITYVDNGGSHESNPYGGVPMGIAQDGQPNLVEEGEVIYKLNGSPYVYSKRLKMSKELKDKYKFKGDTFADGALEAQKESEERPNDPISQRGLNAIMRDLANEQEKKRAEKAERQAKYAFGGWLADGHKFKDGGGLIFYNGKFYRDNGKGSYMPEDGKGSYLTAQDLKMLGNAVQYYNGNDFEIEEDWRERMSNPYPRQQAASTYTDPLDERPTINPTGESYSDYVNRMHTEAERNAAWNKGIGTGVPLTDQMAGNPYYGTALSPLQQNSGWRNFLLPPDSVTTTPSAATTAATNVTPSTSTSTSTSKSTSTGKGTGTGTATSKTVGRQLTDGERRMQEWLFSNPENFALANKAASEWGARNFKDANDIWNVALTGEPGPAYNGIDEAYRKANKTTWEDLVGRPSFKAEYPTPDEEMRAALAGSADRFYNTEEGVEARQKAWERANGVAEDVNNPIDNYKTWMRYAPIFGSGLALALDPWINRPDYTNADLVLEAGKSAGNVDFNPIGDYLPYKPYDRLFYANQLAANQAATRRALLNTTGGNAAAARGLLLAADNQGINQMGNLWRQAEEYNEANRQAIAEFNRGTNMFNSEGRLKADMANQGQANVRINAAIEAAKLRALEDDRVAETRSANFTNFLDNLGDLGRENLYYNMVNNNKALYYGALKNGQSPYKGEGSTNNPVTMPMPIQQYTKTGKNGGYLTIKKKKR